MAECRLCGIDINENDLCQECKSEFGKRSIRQVFFKASLKVNLLIMGVALFLFAAVIALFQFLNLIEAQNLAEAGYSLKEARIAASREFSDDSTTQRYDITQDNKLPPVDNKAEYLNWMTKHTSEDIGYLEQRWELSRRYIASKELVGDDVIRAFLRTPREHFVRTANLKRAYDDSWLAIGYGATITDPDVVCMMTTSLDVKPDSKVLEIGTGSGYQSAFLAHLSNHVYTIEIITPLAIETNQLYKSLEEKYPMYKNIKRKLDDGFYGWEQYAPFDRIIITCAIDHVPPPLIKQLAVGGIIVLPLGPPGRQLIMQERKTMTTDNKISLERRDVYNGLGVGFIPMLDASGGSHSNIKRDGN